MKKFVYGLIISVFLCSSVQAAVLCSTHTGTPVYTTKTTLAAAVAASDCVGKTIVVTTPQTVNDITFPSTMAVKVEKGGQISVNSGKTATFNGPITGTGQIFAGAGSVVFNSDIVNPNGWFAAGQVVTFNADLVAGPSLISSAMVIGTSAKLLEASPYWWANNTIPGTTDMTAAINSAIAALPGGGKIKLLLGKHKLTDEIAITSGLTIEGSSHVDKFYPAAMKTGYENPTFLFQATAGKAIFLYGEKIQDTAIRNMCLSAVETPTQLSTSPVAGKYGIKATGARPNSSWRNVFEELTFYNFERGISVVGLSGDPDFDWQFDNVTVKHCTFFNNTAGIYFDTTNADYWQIQNCGFLVPDGGDGIFMKRSGFMIIQNTTAGPIIYPGATDVDFIHVSDYFDTIHLIGNQSEGMTNHLHVDTSPNFVNTYFPIIADGEIFESPLLIERQCKFVSNASRFTAKAQVTGTNVIINSSNDSFAIEQTPTAISGSGTVVTVTLADHGFKTSDVITAAGSSTAGYNVTNALVTFISSSQFSYAGTGIGTPTTMPTITTTKPFYVLANGNTFNVFPVPYRYGSGTPVGAVEADRIGQEYLDTGTNTWYKAYNLNGGWAALN